jgi:ligand-binding SRPBCC domain-containing protein
MAVYERETVVEAPFEEVWEFHSSADGLVALTPGWMNLRVEEAVGPDGERDPEVLDTGSKIKSSVRPFGVGPRQQWISYVTTRREGEDHAMFQDEMLRGPFPEWLHTHRFEAVDGGTRVHDRVEYRLPGGPIGRALGPFGVVGFEPMFRFRHSKTKELLEDA